MSQLLYNLKKHNYFNYYLNTVEASTQLYDKFIIKKIKF